MRAKEFIYEASEQGNRWTGDEYYRHLVEQGYNPEELTEQELEEGWKQWAAGGALALGALGAHQGINNKSVDQPQLSQQPTITQGDTPSNSSSNNLLLLLGAGGLILAFVLLK